MSEPTAGSDGALNTVLLNFALRVRDAQQVARRLGYVAAGVEENIEDVTDFHAAVETLLGAAPVSDTAIRLLRVMTDDDRAVLRDMRRARNELVYDFFIDHPIERADATPDNEALRRADQALSAIGVTLEQARSLTGRLEIALAENS